MCHITVACFTFISYTVFYQLNIHVCHSTLACFPLLSLEYSCVTLQWHVLLLSVEYSCVQWCHITCTLAVVLLLSVEYSRSPQYSGLFYFYQLNIHVCHSTVACFPLLSLEYSCVTLQWHVLLLSVEYSCVPQYSGMFDFLSLEYSCVTLQ